jgi:hypothetical protein
MNRYGRQAMRHWQENLPQRYRQIEDPETFFTHLGEQMQQQVIEGKRSLAGDDPGGETFLDKLGRLNMAEANAVEQVIREMLPATEQTTTSG